MKSLTFDTRTKGQRRIGPYLITVPITMTIFALYTNAFLPFGVLGVAGGALIGLLWAAGLGFAAERLARREEWHVWLANTPVFLGIIAIGLSIGGGLMYQSMMYEALNEPSTTQAVLSALMQPAVPFFIILNTLMELLVISLIVFWNWDTSPHRRTLILIGVLVYFVHRIWTICPPPRLKFWRPLQSRHECSSRPATDYRSPEQHHLCALSAAFIPVRLHRRVMKMSFSSFTMMRLIVLMSSWPAHQLKY
jgi:hypothetical protein